METKKTKWNEKQSLLRNILSKPERFTEAIQLCLEQHAMVHSSQMSQINGPTFEDELWDALDETVFRTMPTVKDETIAWNIWHITRIEDITMNILVAGEAQVLNAGNWLAKMNVAVRDTGNAMTDQEIVDLSSGIQMAQLYQYRLAVGKRTRDIIQGLRPADLKRKMEAARLQRILDEGAVLDVPAAKWLIDFWGRKNAAGILLMPVTRHPLVHLNESLRLKKLLLAKR